MGMFDYIECRYHLPGDVPDWAKVGPIFQTKDLQCQMDLYIITEDGALQGYDHSGAVLLCEDFTGIVEFGGWNIVSTGPGIYTADGEDAWSVDYRATFVAGKLTSLIETANKREPAVKQKYKARDPLTEEELAVNQKRFSESLLGKRIYTLWGTETAGRYVRVIAENAQDLICQHRDGAFETVPRFQRDNCFFDSEKEALASRKAKSDAWEQEKREFEAEIASRDRSNAVG